MTAPSNESPRRPVTMLLARLEQVRAVASGWTARCPVHDDRKPSLSISESDDQMALVFCHAGCRTESIVAALGMEMADLFVPRRDGGQRIVATYDYRSADGRPLHQVVRLEPKAFRQRRWTGRRWAWGLRDVEPVLYRLPELIASQGSEVVLIVEGEKDADRLAKLGFTVTTNPGGAGKWRAAFDEPLRGRDVVVIADNDEPGRQHAAHVAGSLRGSAESVIVLELPGLPPKRDVSDWLDWGHGRDDLERLIADASSGSRGSGVPPNLDTTDGSTLGGALDATVTYLTRFVRFAGPEHADAVALWVAHTHAPLERIDQSPILAITSTVKQSGKSRVLEVVDPVVRRPWQITRPSEAVLFRKIDRDHPTILLDEADTIFNDSSSAAEGIRAVFDAGNRRGAKVPRVVGKGAKLDLVEFDVFCPKATAGIGALPETVVDRAILIPMKRRLPAERVERFRRRAAVDMAGPLRRALETAVGRVTDFTVDEAAMPAQLDDRAQDGWEVLLAIADQAGGSWPARARAAAVALFERRRALDDNPALQLLADCRTIFAETRASWLPTTVLRSSLLALEGSRWADIRGKEVTPHYLARLLAGFDIRPTRRRHDGGSQPIHGYAKADFADAWARYGSSGGGTDTTGTSDTSRQPAFGSGPRRVPDVPDVTHPADSPDGRVPLGDLGAVAHAVFGDDIEPLVGLA